MSTAPRRIALRTRGHGHGPITRLMSPSDLGQVVKPFVFLDIFDIHAIASQPASQGMATRTRKRIGGTASRHHVLPGRKTSQKGIDLTFVRRP